MLFSQIFQCMVCWSISSHFQQFHFMMVQFTRRWLQIFDDYINLTLLIVGGSYRIANLFGSMFCGFLDLSVVSVFLAGCLALLAGYFTLLVGYLFELPISKLYGSLAAVLAKLYIKINNFQISKYKTTIQY